MISRLVLFGATGDLAARYLFPALAAMHAAGRLPGDFGIIGAAREAHSDAAFREHLAGALATHAADVPPDSRSAILAATRYTPVDVGDAADVRRVMGRGSAASVAAYLALPPALFAPTIRTLAEAGIGDDGRIAVEKPFGSSQEDARALNALVAELFAADAERVVFRVDHVLGMATVQNLIGLRIASRAVDAMWNARAIEQVQILWEEVLGLEGRAGFFDATGALRDVMQNHMLQVLAIVAMEPPAGAAARDARDAKVRALRAVRPPPTDLMEERTRRARYVAGTLPPSAGNPPRDVPAYADEDGVDPGRQTETLAELSVEIDTPRWEGTRFLLRGGKALAGRRKGVLIRFRAADGASTEESERLWIGIDGPNDISLRWIGAAGTDVGSRAVVLDAPAPAAELPPYGNVLGDFLSGGSRLSVRGDEVEEAWRIVTPVIKAWRAGHVPLEEYPAGADGLPARRGPSSTPD
jgi:glucose-6-phosphate 1-dehydrogenase